MRKAVWYLSSILSGIGLSAPIATAQQVLSMDAYYSGNCTGSDINPPNTKPISAFVGPGIPGTEIIGADISIFKFPPGFQYAEVSVQNPGDTTPNYLVWASGQMMRMHTICFRTVTTRR
jgi:hypothetical protein